MELQKILLLVIASATAIAASAERGPCKYIQ